MSMSTTCTCCGKPLSDALSMELGLGPVCRIALKTREANNMTGNLFTPRADYSYSIESGVVCIIDHDNGKSVTNDAPAVIADLAAAGIDVATAPVIYCDTMGVWDQLVCQDGKFQSFRSLNKRDRDAAVALVRS